MVKQQNFKKLATKFWGTKKIIWKSDLMGGQHVTAIYTIQHKIVNNAEKKGFNVYGMCIKFRCGCDSFGFKVVFFFAFHIKVSRR